MPIAFCQWQSFASNPKLQIMIILSRCARGTTAHELWEESSLWLFQARGLVWLMSLKLQETSPYIGILDASGNIVDIVIHRNTWCFVRTSNRNINSAMIEFNRCFPIHRNITQPYSKHIDSSESHRIFFTVTIFSLHCLFMK